MNPLEEVKRKMYYEEDREPYVEPYVEPDYPAGADSEDELLG